MRTAKWEGLVWPRHTLHSSCRQHSHAFDHHSGFPQRVYGSSSGSNFGHVFLCGVCVSGCACTLTTLHAVGRCETMSGGGGAIAVRLQRLSSFTCVTFLTGRVFGWLQMLGQSPHSCVFPRVDLPSGPCRGWPLWAARRTGATRCQTLQTRAQVGSMEFIRKTRQSRGRTLSQNLSSSSQSARSKDS